MTSHKKAMDDNEKLLLDLKKANNQLRVRSLVQIRKDLGIKLLIFSYPSDLTYVVGAQKNRLIETVLLSTHNISFGKEIRKFKF